MGNLSNLYISQSFQSLIHLGNDGTASATLTELQDGYGNGIGISVNTEGDIHLSGSLTASLANGFMLIGGVDGVTKVIASSSFANGPAFNQFTESINSFTASSNEFAAGINAYTQSNNAKWANLDAVSSSWVTESETGSYAMLDRANIFTQDQTIQGTLNVDTINATTIHTLIESSSVIYSSGSNVIGDDISDTQTLIGNVIVSGSQELTGSLGMSGTFNLTGSINLTGLVDGVNISVFETNVNSTTASLNTSVSNLNTFSASANISIANLNTTTASLLTSVSNLNTFSASTNISIANLNTTTASLNNSVTLLNSFSSSTNISITNLNSTSASTTQILNTLVAATASYATTGSSNFSGSQTITGSIYGNVTALSVTSNTASMNMSLGNLFTLTLPTGSTRLVATDVRPGQTVNLLVTQAASGGGTLILGTQFKQPAGFFYVPSATGSAEDILTFATFTTTGSIYTLNAKQLL